MRSFVFLIFVLPGAALKVKPKNDKEPEGYFCKKADGFGAELHCKLAAFANARHNNKCYYHAPFSHRLQKYGTNGKHPNSNDIDLDAFVGLKSDQGCKELTSENMKGKWHSAKGPVESQLDAYYAPEVRAELRRMYDEAPNKKPKLEDCEVAIHMRKPSSKDRAGHHYHHIWRWSSNAVIYEVISTKFKDKKVCVFSEGQPEDFGKIGELDNAKLFLDGKADWAFHNFVQAPELVIAKSSMSYTAALLNQGKVYYLDYFWHHMLQDWEKINYKTPCSRCGLTSGPTVPSK